MPSGVGPRQAFGFADHLQKKGVVGGNGLDKGLYYFDSRDLLGSKFC